ncbi:phage holin family protein [Candidatus Nanosynbacter sp. TM7-074]|uniref:Phage holin family protein n=1 Tax=Candidatus Nanosynbacter sp. TM7-074 TaxID=3158573 RepID=A0AB39JCV8_9BACT
MKRQFATFLLRWILNSVGIWVAVRLLGNGNTEVTSAWTFMMAGLIFSLVNSTLKPIVTILALPAILLTLGLFTLVVNGFMVYVSLALAPGISMTFAHSIVAGIILSLVNYIIGSALVLQREEKEQYVN